MTSSPAGSAVPAASPVPALSRLMLGTVQFGLRYGVANTTGQVTPDAVREILALAAEGGVNALDTAAGYGESEDVLGRSLHALGLTGHYVVVSKVAPLPDGLTATEADAAVEASVTGSLRRLRMDRLPVCLFHREENYVYADSLRRLAARGLIVAVGCSVMTPECAGDILNAAAADAVQLPTSLLDRRYIRAGLLARMHRTGVRAFARSVYLQGLLLMPEAAVPDYLAGAIPARRRFADLARAAGMSLSEMALRWTLSLEGVTSAVVGIDTPDQMRENLRIAGNGTLPADLMAAIDAEDPNLDLDIVRPDRWKDRMAAAPPPPPPSASGDGNPPASDAR